MIKIVADQIEMLGVDDIYPGRNLAKIHTPDQIVLIGESILEFGWTQPILIDKKGQIIAGRGRWLAAKSIGMEKVPCCRAGHLSDAQVAALMLADNRIAEAEWDTDILKAELADLKELDEAMLGLTGFDFDEIDKLLNGALTEDADDGPELPKIQFLSAGGHKIEMTPEEAADLTSIISAWSKHHGSYRGFVQNLIDALRNYS